MYNQESSAAPARHVLVVDDEEAIRQVLRQWLEGAGFDVDVAKDGWEAVKQCREHEYAAVTMDLEMPRMRGTDAIRAIRVLHPHLPVVVLTGSINGTDEALQSGANRVLEKPIYPSEVEEELLRLIQSGG